MFLLLPIGHDRPIYDRPWLTLGLIVLCSGIFLGTWTIDHAAQRDLEAAARQIDRIHQAHPEARVSFSVHGLPDRLDALIQSLVDERPGRAPRLGDAELESAVRDLVAAMNRKPSLRFGYRPGAPSVLGAVGHVFMHAGVFHLLGNMLFLWVAGGLLECFWRRWAFALLYVVSGAAGLVAHHLSDPDSLYPLVGASGAIAGLIGAFVVCYPTAGVRMGYLGWFIRPWVGSFFVRAWIVIPVWGLSELLHALFAAGGGVAYWAHVGGFACGLIAGAVARLAGWVAVDAGYDSAAPPAAYSAPPPPAAFGVAPPPAARGAAPPPATFGVAPARRHGETAPTPDASADELPLPDFAPPPPEARPGPDRP